MLSRYSSLTSFPRYPAEFSSILLAPCNHHVGTGNPVSTVDSVSELFFRSAVKAFGVVRGNYKGNLTAARAVTPYEWTTQYRQGALG
jgi:hypothetical protein